MIACVVSEHAWDVFQIEESFLEFDGSSAEDTEVVHELGGDTDRDCRTPFKDINVAQYIIKRFRARLVEVQDIISELLTSLFDPEGELIPGDVDLGSDEDVSEDLEDDNHCSSDSSTCIPEGGNTVFTEFNCLPSTPSPPEFAAKCEVNNYQDPVENLAKDMNITAEQKPGKEQRLLTDHARKRTGMKYKASRGRGKQIIRRRSSCHTPSPPRYSPSSPSTPPRSPTLSPQLQDRPPPGESRCGRRPRAYGALRRERTEAMRRAQ